jgi:hypothetical protein
MWSTTASLRALSNSNCVAGHPERSLKTRCSHLHAVSFKTPLGDHQNVWVWSGYETTRPRSPLGRSAFGSANSANRAEAWKTALPSRQT